MPRARLRKPDLAVLDPVSVLAQDRRVGGELHPLWSPDDIVPLPRAATLVLDRDRESVRKLQEVDLRADPGEGRVERDRRRRRKRRRVDRDLGGRRRTPTLLVDAPVHVLTFNGVRVVAELAFRPLQPGQPRAVDMLVEDPCGHERKVVGVHGPVLPITRRWGS